MGQREDARRTMRALTNDADRAVMQSHAMVGKAYAVLADTVDVLSDARNRVAGARDRLRQVRKPLPWR
jgi:hypothetical protein